MGTYSITSQSSRIRTIVSGFDSFLNGQNSHLAHPTQVAKCTSLLPVNLRWNRWPLLRGSSVQPREYEMVTWTKDRYPTQKTRLTCLFDITQVIHGYRKIGKRLKFLVIFSGGENHPRIVQNKAWNELLLGWISTTNNAQSGQQVN